MYYSEEEDVGRLTMRKSCSAPVRLQKSVGTNVVCPLAHFQASDVSTKHAWASSEQLEGCHQVPPGSSVQSANESTNTSAFGDSCAKNTQCAQLDHLHVHSFSYPEWPTLSHTDPAIDLIKCIKEELSKFDHHNQ